MKKLLAIRWTKGRKKKIEKERRKSNGVYGEIREKRKEKRKKKKWEVKSDKEGRKKEFAC